MAVIMPIAGKLYNRAGPRLLIGLGLVFNAISFYQFSRLALSAGYWDIFLPQALQGFGFGFIFVSVSTAALSTIENRFITAASGLYNVVRQVFGSIGITLSAALLTRGENWNRAILMEHINVYKDRTSEMLRILSSYFYSRGMDAAGAYDRALKVMEGVVTRQSSMLSYNRVFFIIAVVFLISIPLIFLLKPPKMTLEADTSENK
jgi:DHA2 family multidrug resistance protein